MSSSAPQGPATRFARSRSEWQSPDWWTLEARAWTAAPAVRHALVFFAPVAVWQEFVALQRRDPRVRLGWITVPVNIAVITVPTVTAAWLAGAFAHDETMPMVLLGWLGVLVLAGTVWSLVDLLRDPQLHAPRSTRVFYLWVGIPSAVSALVGLVLLTQGRIDQPPALLPFAATAAVAAFALTRIRSTGSPSAAAAELRMRRLERALAQTPAQVVAAATADLAEAIDALAASGIVAPEQLARARTLPPGQLALTLAARSDMPPRGDRAPER